jgi:hypothetical protein
LGLEASTYSSTPISNVELSSKLNFEDNDLLSKDNSFEDDHINQTPVSSGFVNQLITISISKDSFLLIEFTLSNWKPPKYS